MGHPLIDEFEAQGSRPRGWIAGLTKAQLTAFPVPGTWSVAQLVVHVLDSDMAAGHRMRRIVAEETPLLIAYDETAFASRLHYHETDLGLVVELFEAHRRHIAQWLRLLPEEAFARAGVHNQRGKVTLGQFVQIYVDHVTHHERFLLAKRRALGVP